MQPAGPINYGQNCGQICRTALQKKKDGMWSTEKPKLDNARKWTGIYYINPDDMEFKDTLKNARKNEMPLESAVPCKIVCTKDTFRRTRYACIIEAHESTRTRSGTTQPRDHEDHVAENGFNTLSQKISSVHKPFPPHQAMKNPDAKAAGDRDWEWLENLPAWQVTKIKSKREVIEKAQRGKDCSLCYIDRPVPPQECGVGAAVPKIQKVVWYSEVML